jgi:hypothetical protein
MPRFELAKLNALYATSPEGARSVISTDAILKVAAALERHVYR